MQNSKFPVSPMRTRLRDVLVDHNHRCGVAARESTAQLFTMASAAYLALVEFELAMLDVYGTDVVNAMSIPQLV